MIETERVVMRALLLSCALMMSTFAPTPFPAQARDVPERPKPNYPHTRADEIVEQPFGEKVADPYRWLENDVRGDGDVKKWVESQNNASKTYLDSLPGRDVMAGRMKALINFPRWSVPRKAGKRLFFTQNSGLQNQSILYVKDSEAAEPRALIDPNQWAKDGATALAEWVPSSDGSKLLYAVQDGGTDWRILRVIDVETGKQLADEVRWVKFSGLSWKVDGSGFFYSRFPAPEKNGTFQSLNTNQSLYFHKIGASQESDQRIFATPRFPKRGHSAEVTDDGQYLLVTSTESTDDRFELHVGRIDSDKPIKLRKLVSRLEFDWQLAGSVGSRFYFRTNKDAPRSRVVVLDVEDRKAKLIEIVPQSEDTLVGVSLIGKRLVLAYLGDAKSEAVLAELDGRIVSPVRLPGIGSAAGFSGKGGDPETFYVFSSYATPPTVYRFNTDSGEAEVFAKPKVAFDPEQYETDQVFYTSKDGTRIPMFIVKRKDVIGPAPTLLYGYGGFNLSQTPGFSAMRLAWLEQGGVLAIANLRGGGEYGKAWHDAGKLHAKQNVFDDFIAAGEHLIAQKVTAKGKLAIEGRSNGGLLVGAVVNQRPDLFAAALPAVGVMDMLRFNRFTAGRYWVDDYGDPAKPEDWRVLRSYSPYHNVASGKDYPAILVTTADTDDRVVPGHSFKYVAALQAASIGNRPHLIRIETRAGHGSGKPTDKLIAESADMYAFIAHWTGLEIKSMP
jgi:prolyl oligopeptidase